MTGRSIRKLAVVSLVAVVCSGASCFSGDGGGYDRPSSGRDRTGGYDRDADTDVYHDRADRPNRIPRQADVVREDVGKLRWRADLDGAVYIYDRDKDVVRYTGPVRRGDEVMVQPDDDRVTVGGRVVSSENLRTDGYHQLYFVTADRLQSNRYDDRDAYPRQQAPRDTPVANVPAGAKKLARGSGVVEIAKTPATGTVYVVDEDAGQVVYTTDLRRGTTFRVVPREAKVYADGEIVSRPKFAKGHTLTLYFVGR